MEPNENLSLWGMVAAAGLNGRWLADATHRIMLLDLESGSAIGSPLPEMSGRSVLLFTRTQLATALSLIELDGFARRLVICPAGIATDQLAEIISQAEIDVVICDSDLSKIDTAGRPVVVCSAALEPLSSSRAGSYNTEWVLFTSGTTGRPKMAVHHLSGLIGAINNASGVWATFYDMRRYGGLQIFLRAMLGQCSFILSDTEEALNDHLDRLARGKVTHLSGTPSHWRRVLMSSVAHKISPAYVRLSGEIADQGVLDGLRALYPNAKIVHAYASTEAGVGFEVDDGKAGFPESFVGQAGHAVELKVEDGTLCIRSKRSAARYLASLDSQIAKKDGFVDTGDMVELRNGRYYFIGRRDGVINVGGQKVHPEEVEAVVNRHPRVRISIVYSKKNSIIGSVVAADVVTDDFPEGSREEASLADLEKEIREMCSRDLPRHKVPALIRFVPSLAMTVGGKLARHHA